MSDWRIIPVNERYEVSSEGLVRNRSTGRILAPCTQKRGGYLAVSLWQNNRGKTWPVHQLVALSFHGPRPSSSHDAAHRDGDKLNNRRENVQWLTKAENEADKVRHGTANIGSRNGSAKLSIETVREIRAAHAGGAAPKDIGARFGVEQSHLSRILSRQLWKDV